MRTVYQILQEMRDSNIRMANEELDETTWRHPVDPRNEAAYHRYHLDMARELTERAEALQIALDALPVEAAERKIGVKGDLTGKDKK